MNHKPATTMNLGLTKTDFVIACILFALAWLTGCANVPKTSITFNPRTKTLAIFSPKDVSIKTVSVETSTNGTFKLEVSGYSATNNLEVVKAVATANAVMLEATAAKGKELLKDAIDAAK